MRGLCNLCLSAATTMHCVLQLLLPRFAAVGYNAVGVTTAAGNNGTVGVSCSKHLLIQPGARLSAAPCSHLPVNASNWRLMCCDQQRICLPHNHLSANHTTVVLVTGGQSLFPVEIPLNWEPPTPVQQRRQCRPDSAVDLTSAALSAQGS